nr:fumarylacetoacetate hydrolase family protein [Plesiomonas shigelloides]
MYQHTDWQGNPIDFPVGKVVCVGQNYAAHIQEMGSVAAAEPVLFLKPDTALCDLRHPLTLLQGYGEVHHETEMAVLIGATLQKVTPAQAMLGVAGYGLALDLTLRELQSECKRTGRPWEKAKAFDGSCPVSGFIPASDISEPMAVAFSLTVNGELRQQGNTARMLTPVAELISYMSRFFTLKAGDVILTGSPEGVGPLLVGDVLNFTFAGRTLQTRVRA